MDKPLLLEVLGRIQEALERAGEALRPFKSGGVEARVKNGGDPVTEADLAVNKALHSCLLRDGEGWLSEETADSRSRLECEDVWIVDPLDGTREFLAGIPEWCVSIAFVRRGIAMAGGITNPDTGETFLGSVSTGLSYKGENATPTARDTLVGATVLASRSEVKRGDWKQFQNASFRIKPTGSVAYKLACVATGLADATWTLTPKHEWDVAAGVALVEAAGGVVRTLDFTRPIFNCQNPLLRGLMACGSNLESEMTSFLRPHIA
jgi:myo-inositol-1(or 4)-monophosphatase